MDDTEEPLDRHEVELPDTRPGMFPKIPYSPEITMDAACLLLGLFGTAWMILGWKWLIPLPFVWYGVGVLMSRNYHALNHAGKYIEIVLPCLDAKTQCGISVTPFPKISKRARGML